MPSSPQRRITTKKRCSRSSDQTESKSSIRETKPRTPHSRANFVQRYQEMHPSGQRAGWNCCLAYRCEKLADAHSPRKQRQFVVFRHRRG